MTFLVFALLGAGLYARATVPCGAFDLTLVEITSVKKNGAALALPASKTSSFESRGDVSVYDPDSDTWRSLRLRWQQP